MTNASAPADLNYVLSATSGHPFHDWAGDSELAHRIVAHEPAAVEYAKRVNAYINARVRRGFPSTDCLTADVLDALGHSIVTKFTADAPCRTCGKAITWYQEASATDPSPGGQDTGHCYECTYPR